MMRVLEQAWCGVEWDIHGGVGEAQTPMDIFSFPPIGAFERSHYIPLPLGRGTAAL